MIFNSDGANIQVYRKSKASSVTISRTFASTPLLKCMAFLVFSSDKLGERGRSLIAAALIFWRSNLNFGTGLFGCASIGFLMPQLNDVVGDKA